MTNPPSVPSLDVAACVRLLEQFASGCDLDADSALVTPQGAAEYAAEATLLRALASALPGMGKDSERLGALPELLLGHLIYPYPSGAVGWRETAGGPVHIARSLRDAIDAARAAQPQETSADD